METFHTFHYIGKYMNKCGTFSNVHDRLFAISLNLLCYTELFAELREIKQKEKCFR